MSSPDRRSDGVDEMEPEKAPWATVDHLNKHMKAGLSQADAQFLYDIAEKEQRQIFHKVDMRLCPMLMILSLISHLDRTNIGNAKIEGLEASLNMTGTNYNVALVVFVIPFMLCAVPSNLLLTKFSRPSTYIGMLVIAWGTIMTLFGVVQDYAGLLVARFFLGILEAGFFPGAIYLLGQWYPPSRTQFRISLFYCANAASGAFSGLLAAAIAKMDGIGNYEGWRWIFIIEGLASVIMGVVCFFCKWLTHDEARFLNLTHIATRGLPAKTTNEDGKSKKFQWSILWSVLTDWQLYLQALVLASSAVPNYGLKFTMPQIIRNMGFTSTRAQLLTAPPYFCGAISALVSSLLADRFTWRMPFIVSAQCLLVIASSILFVKAENIESNVPLCYFSIFLACIGIYPILPGCNAWTINNLAGPTKRAMGIAFMICMGNMGGIVGSFIFLEKEKPKYPTGFGSSLSFAAAGICAALLLEFLYWKINQKNDEWTEEEVRRKYSEMQLEKMGDRSPLFKYFY